MDTQTGMPSTSSHHVSDVEDSRYQDAAVKTYSELFGARLRELRGDLSRADLALKLGVHVNTIGKFERGDSLPDAYLTSKLCSIGRRSPQWLITGTHGFDGTPDKDIKAVELGTYIYVPHFDIQASAGNGSFGDVEKVLAMRPFDSGFIRGELGIYHPDIAICQVAGRSAEPRFNAKDIVMIDRRDIDVRTEGLHIVRMDGALFVKLLQRLPGKVLRVSSHNAEFQPFDISTSDDAERDFDVIGRVRWGGVTVQ
jgi:phage repressor protein C with HTH and peptisase S24 domain